MISYHFTPIQMAKERKSDLDSEEMAEKAVPAPITVVHVPQSAGVHGGQPA